MELEDPFGADEELTDAEQLSRRLVEADLDMLEGLVRMRHERRLTQDDVARCLGRDKSAVSRFERLDSDPRLSTVRRYAAAVGALVQHVVTEVRIDVPVTVGTPPGANGVGVLASAPPDDDRYAIIDVLIESTSPRLLPGDVWDENAVDPYAELAYSGIG